MNTSVDKVVIVGNAGHGYMFAPSCGPQGVTVNIPHGHKHNLPDAILHFVPGLVSIYPTCKIPVGVHHTAKLNVGNGVLQYERQVTMFGLRTHIFVPATTRYFMCSIFGQV